jgi:RNA polymerase sigma factor (sigma-70 family)
MGRRLTNKRYFLISDRDSMYNEESAEDAKLIEQCLNGEEAAWVALVSRYKKLIFSVPIKYGFSRDESADIFQSVCLDLLCELKHLREPQALPAWLIRISFNKCYHLGKSKQRWAIESDALEALAASQEIPEMRLQEIEREHAVRVAVGSLSRRCSRLVSLLFFESPTRSYNEIAKEMSLATGSIGAIRRRCLEELRRTLEQAGVP